MLSPIVFQNVPEYFVGDGFPVPPFFCKTHWKQNCKGRCLHRPGIFPKSIKKGWADMGIRPYKFSRILSMKL